MKPQTAVVGGPSNPNQDGVVVVKDADDQVEKVITVNKPDGSQSPYRVPSSGQRTPVHIGVSSNAPILVKSHTSRANLIGPAFSRHRSMVSIEEARDVACQASPELRAVSCQTDEEYPPPAPPEKVLVHQTIQTDPEPAPPDRPPVPPAAAESLEQSIQTIILHDEVEPQPPPPPPPPTQVFICSCCAPECHRRSLSADACPPGTVEGRYYSHECCALPVDPLPAHLPRVIVYRGRCDCARERSGGYGRPPRPPQPCCRRVYPWPAAAPRDMRAARPADSSRDVAQLCFDDDEDEEWPL